MFLSHHPLPKTAQQNMERFLLPKSSGRKGEPTEIKPPPALWITLWEPLLCKCTHSSGIPEECVRSSHYQSDCDGEQSNKQHVYLSRQSSYL